MSSLELVGDVTEELDWLIVGVAEEKKNLIVNGRATLYLSCILLANHFMSKDFRISDA